MTDKQKPVDHSSEEPRLVDLTKFVRPRSDIQEEDRFFPSVTHEDKRDRLMEQVERKVESVLELWETAERESGRQTPPVFERTMRETLSAIDSRFHPSDRLQAQLKAFGLRRIADEHEVVEREWKKMVESHIGSWKPPHAQEFTLSADEEFLIRADCFVVSVVAKRRSVERSRSLYDRDPQSFWRQIADETGYQRLLASSQSSDIRVEFNGCAVDIFMPREEYERVHNQFIQTNGVHAAFTPYNFIVSDGPEPRITQRHEHHHNLTESFSQPIKYRKQFKPLLTEAIKSVVRAAEDDEYGQGAIEAERRLEQLVASYYAENYDEILADFARPPRRGVGAYRGQFLRTLALIRDRERRVTHAASKRVLARAIERLEKNEQRYLDALADLYFVAEQAGELDHAQGALIVFGPGAVERAARYLKRRVGPEAYNRLVGERRRDKKAYFEALRFGQAGDASGTMTEDVV